MAPGRVPMQRPSSAVNPKRAVDALAILQRAQARTAAEVRDDHAPAWRSPVPRAGSTEAMYS